MSRSPYSYSWTRSGDNDAGGIADLQTDVMRFMAILAICLVAIFALVQSIPLEPVVEPIPAPAPTPKTQPAEPTEPAEPAEPVQTTPPVQSTQPQGFTLQFETDLALTRLVARNEIGLYAIGEDESLRMSVNRGRFSFWPASTPNEFHEMDSSTVPGDVAAALRRMHDQRQARWGVTLPTGMQRQLEELLQTGGGGAIYIAANGQLRLEN